MLLKINANIAKKKISSLKSEIEYHNRLYYNQDVNEISDFCELFAEEFEALFLTPPAQYFAMAAEYWVTKLD